MSRNSHLHCRTCGRFPTWDVASSRWVCHGPVYYDPAAERRRYERAVAEGRIQPRTVTIGVMRPFGSSTRPLVRPTHPDSEAP